MKCFFFQLYMKIQKNLATAALQGNSQLKTSPCNNKLTEAWYCPLFPPAELFFRGLQSLGF